MLDCTSPVLEMRNCLAHAVAPPMISVLSSAFGYSFDDNAEDSHELDLERARALGKAPETGVHWHGCFNQYKHPMVSEL